MGSEFPFRSTSDEQFAVHFSNDLLKIKFKRPKFGQRARLAYLNVTVVLLDRVERAW